MKYSEMTVKQKSEIGHFLSNMLIAGLACFGVSIFFYNTPIGAILAVIGGFLFVTPFIYIKFGIYD